MGNLQNQHNVYIWILTNPQNLYKIRNLQFQPITKGPLSKIRNLHWAFPCRHLGCPKKWFWRTPGGPDNGVEIFGGILLLRFQKMCCSFRGRRSTLDVSIVIFPGRRSTLDVSCCVFFVNRIGRAASSGDKVQIPWRAWHFVTCPENWRKPRTKHRFWGCKFSGCKENS